MCEDILYLTRGTAYYIDERGNRQEVREIPGTSCNCKLDCKNKALILPDHANGTIYYVYIFEGALKIGSYSDLIADSTIL